MAFVAPGTLHCTVCHSVETIYIRLCNHDSNIIILLSSVSKSREFGIRESKGLESLATIRRESSGSSTSRMGTASKEHDTTANSKTINAKEEIPYSAYKVCRWHKKGGLYKTLGGHTKGYFSAN